MARPSSSPLPQATQFEGFFLALKYYNMNKIKEAEEECTKLLSKNPLGQAAWALKMMCLTETTYLDEVDNEELGIAESFLDFNRVTTSARPGTSFLRPTSSRNSNPILRPTTQSGRPLSGVVRPLSSSLRPETMQQAVRTARTARTARAVSSSSARQLRLGTASMVSGGDGPFVNLGRLNIEKYASDPLVNCQLFDHVFHHEGDARVAVQIAMFGNKASGNKEWFWKNQLAKCYLRLGQLNEAYNELLRSIDADPMPETYVFLARIASRMDQSLQAVNRYKSAIKEFPTNVTLLTGLARIYEQMNEVDESAETYKLVLQQESNNIEAIACLATGFYYNDKPEVALMLYRRIMQMGVSNCELFLNIGLCCFACQQFDFALSSITRALTMANDSIAADIWYNVGHIMMEAGDEKMATRCFTLALSRDPQHSESLNNLGVIRQRQGKLDQARSLFHNALTKSAHLFEPHFNLAAISLKLGQPMEARTNIYAAYGIFPEHEPTINLKKQIDKLFQGI